MLRYDPKLSVARASAIVFCSASAGLEPELIGTRSSTASGVVAMSPPLGRRAGERRIGHGLTGPGRVGDVPAQHRGDVRLEELERRAVLCVAEPAGVGVQVHHAVAELLVVAVHLVDDLLRAADQSGTTGNEVVEVGEDRLQAEPLLERALRG